MNCHYTTYTCAPSMNAFMICGSNNREIKVSKEKENDLKMCASRMEVLFVCWLSGAWVCEAP